MLHGFLCSIMTMWFSLCLLNYFSDFELEKNCPSLELNYVKLLPPFYASLICHIFKWPSLNVTEMSLLRFSFSRVLVSVSPGLSKTTLGISVAFKVPYIICQISPKPLTLQRLLYEATANVSPGSASKYLP